MVIHTVQSGETIYSVARNYDVSPTLLALSNGITGSLVVGEDLVVLFPEQVHTVRVGETLSEIAALYGTSVRKLYQNNYYLKGKNTLYPGQTLVISYTDMPSRDILTNGYAYPYVNANVLKTSLPYVDYLSPFTYGMTFSGNLIPPKDEEMLDAAYRLGTYGALHLSTLDANDRFDTALATNIFNNYVARETLLKEIAETMRQKNFSLIDVDFEYINGADAENYAAFVQDLKQLGYPVIAAAAPKTSREQKGQLYEGHDYALLGDAADYLFVMTYEWGYTYGPPMAVAPLPNVRRVLEFAVTETQPDKILMGIPNYGYDFSLPYVAGASRATSIGNRR
ncbi:MAG: LysM peptidoglycan-binding domain-containing protein, partial [Clostridia bacterium]|nr:LysM peptidoglycan-binding domain-containing protein [Clostridia bacterium]